MKILITGGHSSPAISIIESLHNKNIVYVGREFLLDKKTEKTLEYKEILRKKIKFINLNTGKLNRELSFKSIIDFFNIPIGFINAYKIIKNEKPDIVLSFGSYIAIPICIIAWLKKIPVYIHEQTIEPGLTNRLLSKISKKIFISFPQSLKFFPTNKTLLTGNPIKQSILNPKKIMNIKKIRPVIFITGGSLGSHSINLIIKDIAIYLLKKYMVIIQTGSADKFNDFNVLNNIKNRLPNNIQQNFYIFKSLSSDEISYLYSISDLVISRAGANTTFELIYLKKPCILIPLPWSVKNEQEKHAQLITNAHAGEIFYQNQTSNILLKIIDKILNNLSEYKNNFNNLYYLIKTNASQKIIETIFSN